MSVNVCNLLMCFGRWHPLVLDVCYGIVQLWEPLLQRHGVSVFEEAVGAGGGAHNAVVDKHCVVERYLQGGHFGHGDIDKYGVLEGRGVPVAALDADNGRNDAFGFHTVETIAYLVHPVHACFFHKAYVVAVVGDAHLITFVVFDFVSVRLYVHRCFLRNVLCAVFVAAAVSLAGAANCSNTGSSFVVCFLYKNAKIKKYFNMKT